MHDNKTQTPVTTWPPPKLFNPTPILTHPRILKQTSRRFSSKKSCQISNLNKSLIPGNHVYLNCIYHASYKTATFVIFFLLPVIR